MFDEHKPYIDWLEQHNIAHIELNPPKVDLYKQEWFDRFVPPEKREEALKCYCFDTDEYCGYLWHIFSYELLKCDTGERAISQFNGTDKCVAILLANIDNFAFQINDASKLSAEDIGELQDVILTDIDFRWTYAKTHESDLGPYYFVR